MRLIIGMVIAPLEQFGRLFSYASLHRVPAKKSDWLHRDLDDSPESLVGFVNCG
ncbi:MAG: hypothetical protein P8L85_16285 [Rubripirellula sp.]|nr:hypothetical protein [Rubripirellula sp.]